MEKTSRPLEKISCIHYLLCFQKDLCETRALIDLDSEFNAMTPAYAVKLGLKIWKTDIEAQKINGFTFDIFRMVLADF